MNKLIPLFAFAFIFASASTAVPEDWVVDLAAQPPQVFTLQRPRGETYEIEAVLKRHGKPFEPAITNACIYWQTNGMENLYWSAPASVSNDVLRATWLPSMDPGAATVRGYIGDPGHIYAAAFQFRFISSPGATPNELPLPQKVIDFAKVRVLNPPWSGGGGVDTNAVIDIIHKTVDGAARPLPRYLHYLEMDDTYPEAAAEWYDQADYSGERASRPFSCSAVRDGGFLYRNYDWKFDDAAEFVVRMSAGPNRFASVGVANVGTNLTEEIVTSGQPSRYFKCLPGHTVDGINENGVVCEVNVVGGDPQTNGWHTTGDLHPLAAVRWVLDHATNAQHAATYIAANIRFPAGWSQNFHYMIADETSTYIVENGTAYPSGGTGVSPVSVLTNFRLHPTRDTTGEGQERYDALASGANITSQWWTLTYTPSGYRASDLPGITGESLAQLFNYWGNNPRESHRGERFGTMTWWQTVHTSVYDITNRVLRIAVQETDDWYVFAIPGGTGVSPVQVRAIATEVVAPVASDVTNLSHSVTNLVNATNNLASAISDLKSSKADNSTVSSAANALTNYADRVAAQLHSMISNGVHAIDADGNVWGLVTNKRTVVGWKVTDARTLYAPFPSIADQVGTILTDQSQGVYNIDYKGQTTSGANLTLRYVRQQADWGMVFGSGYTSTTIHGTEDDTGPFSFTISMRLATSSVNVYAYTLVKGEWEVGGDVTLGIISRLATTNDVPHVDLSGLVPYDGAVRDVSLGTHRLISLFGVVQTIIDWYGMEIESIEDGFGVRYGDIGISSHGASAYGMEDFHLNFPFGKDGDIAVEGWSSLRNMVIDANTNATADCECISTNLCSIISPKIDEKINNSVNANMNTFVDGDTGVEYRGTFYGGSLYYVPTGNVYPPNN